MPHDRSHDLLLLIACGLPIACGPEAPSTDGGEHSAEIDAAVAACGDFATKAAQCHSQSSDGGGSSYLYQLGYCVSYLGYASHVGPACVGAVEDHFACLASLDCSELTDDDVDDDVDVDDTGGAERPCAMELDALDAACGFDEGD